MIKVTLYNINLLEISFFNKLTHYFIIVRVLFSILSKAFPSVVMNLYLNRNNWVFFCWKLSSYNYPSHTNSSHMSLQEKHVTIMWIFMIVPSSEWNGLFFCAKIINKARDKHVNRRSCYFVVFLRSFSQKLRKWVNCDAKLGVVKIYV